MTTQVLIPERFSSLTDGKGNIRTKITGKHDVDMSKCSSLRHVLSEVLCKTESFDPDQRAWAETLIGETTNNAFIHSQVGGFVTTELETEPHCFKLKVANPDVDDFDPTKISECAPWDEECGRGLTFMEGAIRELRGAGFQVEHKLTRVNHRSPARVIVELEIHEKEWFGFRSGTFFILTKTVKSLMDFI
jgi:hypothetical protein